MLFTSSRQHFATEMWQGVWKQRVDRRTDYAQAGQERARGKEKCTTDTDQVDREIKQLREKKKQLEQQLAHKNNDTYRRQHAHTSDTMVYPRRKVSDSFS